jgi:ribosomal protein S18 acetylase RimI-like enzyme
VTGYFDAAPRPVSADDHESVRALVIAALGVTPYVDRVLELLANAERGDPETRALIMERDGTVAALALFGPVSGATGAWELSTLLMAPAAAGRELGRHLLDAVLTVVKADQGRFLLAELPADPVIGTTLTLLRKEGFRQVGRIPDFYRDGVAMLFLRYDVGAPRHR